MVSQVEAASQPRLLLTASQRKQYEVRSETQKTACRTKAAVLQDHAGSILTCATVARQFSTADPMRTKSADRSLMSPRDNIRHYNRASAGDGSKIPTSINS